MFAGSTPLGRGLYINLTSHGKEYDGIIETWKKYFIDNKTIYTYSGNDGDSLCCIDGKWYTSDEACIALGLGINELEEYRYFYGKFW